MTPVLHLLAGPNGAGKSTFYRYVLEPETHLPFVNADVLAAENWPGDEVAHAYAAAEMAAKERAELIVAGVSFVTETVFSHRSKLDLIALATSHGFRVTLHIVVVSPDQAVARVASRVATGGHDVPEQKIRDRHARLATTLGPAVARVHEAHAYDNSSSKDAFRKYATWWAGVNVFAEDVPTWAPALPLD